MMSCTGNKFLKTPNLDRLAQSGYRFDKTYCANPVSMPSRFSLMTGRQAAEVGTRDNNKFFNPQKVTDICNESSIGNLLIRADYETFYSGKTHLYNSKDLLLYGFTLKGQNPYDEPAEFAESFFSSRAQMKKPFLLVLSFLNPHDICYDAGFDARYPNDLKGNGEVATKKYLDIKSRLSDAEYKKQIPPPPGNIKPLEVLNAKVTTSGTGYRDWTNDQWDLYRWMYYRLTEEVDGQIGRVLAALDKSGLSENTIIVFTSDHGEHNQAHGLVHKTYLLEEAQRVPLIFSGKGIKKGISNDTLLVCNGLDIVPTICDLVGIQTPQNLTGISLKSYLTSQEKHPKRDYLVTESSTGYQITDGRYKYTILEFAGYPEMLFDIKKDKGETNNLTNNTNYSTIKEGLKKKLINNLMQRNLWPLKSAKNIDYKNE
jgi:choline-sulfatase